MDSALRELETREQALLLEASLIDFTEAAWPEIDPSTFQLNWHHEAVAEHLEAVTNGQIRKLLINLPPRFTKSLMVSVAWPAWIWCRAPGDSVLSGPQVKFLCLSYSGDLVLDHANITKRLVQSQWYQERWGTRVSIRRDAEAAGHFDTTAGGTRISSSIGGTVTGRGGDYKIIDDPHNIKNVESQTMRDAVINDYDSVLKNRVTDPKTAVEVIVMQRTHEKDLSGHVLETDPDFVHLMLPAEFERDRHCLTYIRERNDAGELVETPFWADPRETDGELLWPERWDAESLAPFKRNPYIWAGQYQQRPAPKGGGVIQREWWQLWGDDSDPELLRPENARFRKHPAYSYILGVVDTAYKQKEENDPSAMAIWGVFTNGQGIPQAMLAHAWRERLTFTDLVQRVIGTARKFKIDLLLVEDKTSGSPLVDEMRRFYSHEEFVMELLPINRNSGDKHARLNAVVPSFTAGQVWTPNKDWANSFIDEVANFPRAAHDECVDLTSMGLMWLRRNGLLPYKQEIKWQEEEDKRRPDRPKPLYPGTV